MKFKKISSNIPEDILAQACKLSQMNQTEALIAGLKELINQHKRKKIIELKGSMKDIKYDVNQMRERTRW